MIASLLFIMTIALIGIIFSLIGVKKGKIGRYISGTFFTVCAVYFGFLAVMGVLTNDPYLTISCGGIVWISGILGYCFLRGKIRGKNETNTEVEQINT